MAVALIVQSSVFLKLQDDLKYKAISMKDLTEQVSHFAPRDPLQSRT
jgi:hypothetical protein